MAGRNNSRRKTDRTHVSRLAKSAVLRVGFYFLLCALSFIFLYPFIIMLCKSLMT